jgi:hypothetical protein
MASTKQLKTTGIVMLIAFFVVLGILFSPLFPGLAAGAKVNGLDYLDNFFNSLAKSSAYYIPDQIKKAEKYNGQKFDNTLKMKSAAEAATVAQLLGVNQITATADGEKVKVSGDLGALTTVVLKDADLMYNNDDKALQAKYGIGAQQVVNSWYLAMGALNKDLTKAGKEEQAKFILNCMSKAIEPAYNFYQVEAKPVKQEMVMLAFALAFYVIYTVWYGFGLLFLFEGLGIKLEDH